MVSDDDVATLATFPLFESVPRAELAWLGARSDVHHLAADAILRDVGASIDEMWIVLAGRVAVHVAKGGTSRRFYDSGPGAVLGAMAFSRMRNAAARLVVEDDTTVCALARSHFPALVRECPALTSALCMDACQPRSPLEAADREDEFSDWLVAHDIDPAAASALASTTVTLTALDHVARVLPKETLGAAISSPRLVRSAL